MTANSRGNRQVRLATRPDGLPTLATWEEVTEPALDPEDGQVQIEITHVSLDPAMRGWIRDRPSYLPPVQIGEVMRAQVAGRVRASRNPLWAEGTWVTGLLGVQQYALSDGIGLRRIDPDRAPVPRYLGALGSTGLTAYFGLLDIGRPTGGDTVVVSGAAGAVGSVAAQIAKVKGCRVIGVAGGAEKCRWLTEGLGLDAAIDYKAEDLDNRLKELAPDGIDVYFDNVGGEILDAALAQLALHARIVICGAISQYNSNDVRGPSNYLSLLVKRASMAGLVLFDYESRYEEATEQLLHWLGDESITAREQIVKGGIDSFPGALLSLFAGGNTGKLVLELA